MGKDHLSRHSDRHPRELAPPRSPSDWSLACALEEVAAAGGELWLVLWQALRDVWLWAEVDVETRRELFNAPPEGLYGRTLRARGEAPELGEVLGTFHLLRWTPDAVEGRHVAMACHHVQEWAEARSMLELAAAFAEAAAVADPDDPERAHLAARTTRRAAWIWRSALWYDRTFRLAVRADHRDAAVGALLGYGMLLYGLGLYEQARPFMEQGARRAARTGRRRKAAEAHHDLMGLNLDLGDFRVAMDHARRAEKHYPLHHSRLPALVHDFALIMVSQHHYRLAYSLLAQLPSCFSPPEAAFVWSTVARASAGVGRAERYAEAERHTLTLVAQHKEHSAAAMVGLAEGARLLRDWDKSVWYAKEAIEIARMRSDAGRERLAGIVLEKIERREAALPDTSASEETAAFARRLIARLRRWRPSSQEPQTGVSADEEDPSAL